MQIRQKVVRLIVLMCSIVFIVFNMSGCAHASVDINKDGTGTMTLTLGKTNEINIENIDKKMDEILIGMEAISGEKDRVAVKSVKEKEDSFVVVVKFKKIQKTRGLGDFNYAHGKDYLAETNRLAQLKNWNKGKIGNLQIYDQTLIKIIEDTKLSVIPYDVEKKESIKIEDFIVNDGVLTKYDNGNLFTYFIAGLSGIDKIDFTFDGQIKIIGGKGLQQTSSNSISVTPKKASANITKLVETIDENGEVVVEAVNLVEDVDCFAGYVYFVTNPNGLMIGLCVVLGISILIGLFICIKKKLFQKFFKCQSMRFIIHNYGLYLMILPGFILLLIFAYLPMGGIVVAFKNYTVDEGLFGSEWVGLRNFVEILTNPSVEFGMMFKNTIVLAVLRFIVNFSGAILLAVLFSYISNKFFKRIVQTVSYFPFFISWVVISGMTYLFLAADGGILNNLLGAVGVKPIAWYSEPRYWPAILTVTSAWKTIGYGSIIYLAIITSINTEIYEAAQIDGAGKWRQFLSVTLPGMFPVIGIQLVLSLGNLVKDDFDQIYSMTYGSSYLRDTTEVIGTITFKAISDIKGMASASAMGLFQSVLSLVLVLGANWLVKKLDMQSLF